MKKLLILFLTLTMLFAIALADEPAEAMLDTTNVPAIPAGTLSASLVSFTSRQTYPVYSAPNSRSIRGANDRARVSTNDWIQVFGTEGDWVMVQYDISEDHYRIGYIDRNALPQDASVAELNLTAVPAVINYDVEVTDDPLASKTLLTRLTENTRVTALASMGDWTYIEGGEGSTLFRGFVPTECLCGIVTDLGEANRAIVGSWKLYAGSSVNAERLTFQADGSMTGRSVLENGTAGEFCGTWDIQEYDTRRARYLNDSEFELTLSRGSNTEQYGLRICRQAVDDGGFRYVLILSDGVRNSSMVLEGGS